MILKTALFSSILLLAASALPVRSSEPKMSFTVVTFGDSTTALRKGADNYTTQLEPRFASAPVPVQFLNRGVGGNTTDMARKRFVRDVLEAKPDLAVIQFGINDSAVDVWKTPPKTESRVSLEKYEANLRYFIEEIRKAKGAVILMTPNQIRWTPRMKEMYGKPPYNPDDELGFTAFLAKYADVMRKLAAEYKLPLVDVYAMYGEWEKANGAPCSKLMQDGMHPNTVGHKMVADALEPLIQKQLLEARQESAVLK